MSSPDKTVVSNGGAATVTSCPMCGTTLATSDPACPQCGTGRGSPEEQAARLRHRVQSQIGDAYELVELLGRGGMGIVFRAHERALDRDVALKVLALDPVLAPEAWARFEREAKLAARLDHPHIVPVYAVGQGQGIAYYTMRLVRGGNVEDLLADRRPQEFARTIDILRAVATALDYAHRNGVVHRDIKPANILLMDGHAMVADFGIAKALEQHEQGAGLTGTGAIGSPGYMAPEQWRGEALDGRADQYALGVVAFEMLTGRRPFESPRVQDLFRMHQSAPVPDATAVRPGLHAGVQQALERALAKHASERFGSATAFVDALAAHGTSTMASGTARAYRAGAPGARQAPPPKPAPRRRVALPLALGAVVLVASAAIAPPTRPYVMSVVAKGRGEVDAFLNPVAELPKVAPAPSLDSLRGGPVAPSASAPADSSGTAPAPVPASTATADARLPVGPAEQAIPATFRLAPKAEVGFIRIVTRGGSARARVDGQTLGFTPFIARVEPGMHYVSVEGAGDTFLPTQHAIDAVAGDTLEAVFTPPGWSVPPRPAPQPQGSAPATTPAPAKPDSSGTSPAR